MRLKIIVAGVLVATLLAFFVWSLRESVVIKERRILSIDATIVSAGKGEVFSGIGVGTIVGRQWLLRVGDSKFAGVPLSVQNIEEVDGDIAQGEVSYFYRKCGAHGVLVPKWLEELKRIDEHELHAVYIDVIRDGPSSRLGSDRLAPTLCIFTGPFRKHADNSTEYACLYLVFSD